MPISNKFINIINNADSFSDRVFNNKPEFGWANIVNVSFAIELYLKAIMEYENGKIETGHNLDELFRKLSKQTQSIIYNSWRLLVGMNISDNNEIKEWFSDNLYACCNVFKKFRYVHEWAGSHVSLESSWDIKQFEKLSQLSPKRKFGKLVVHEGFLYQFEKAIRNYINNLKQTK